MRALPRRPAVSNVEEFARTPTPLEDDASLHDVQFANKRLGWAVGDHGVIWHTRDGGATWSLQASGVDCPLYSICFVTDRIGWIAGGGTMPYAHLSYGVLLQTTDGGRTWVSLLAKPIRNPDEAPAKPATLPAVGGAGGATPAAAEKQPTRSALPRLTHVKFFSTEEGVVAGQGTDNEPGGVFVTDDGGATWRGLAGQVSPGWMAADFASQGAGVVAGPHGRLALVNGEQLTLPRVGSLGLRTLRDIALSGGGSGWLVGDGGLALRTENMGLVWESKPLPEGVRQVCDFHAVCARGKRVWVAGEPGSVIWHSPDGGDSWEKQTTGQTVPVQAIHFVNDDRGCAVGALGLILRTEDGGESWQTARGGGRRLAILMLCSRQDQVALKPVAELSGDLGYRSLVAVIAGEGEIGGTASRTDYAARLAEAVPLAGGSAARVGWQLPLDIPELDRHGDKLLAEWNRRTEGRLNEVLTGGIVRLLRTWRPNVLVLAQPARGDALTALVNQAAIKAVGQAGDSTSFLEQQELTALEPWPVDKVYRRLPPGSTGAVHIEPHRYLERLQTSVRMAAAPAEALLAADSVASSSRDAFRLERTRWDERSGGPLAGGLFGGLSLSPGTAARRPLAPVDESRLQATQQLVNRQRNFEAATEKSLADPIKAGRLIAQLEESIRGMPAAQAAAQLSDLADRYRQQGQWELAEQTLRELVEHYPDEPAALRGMQRLIQSWASAEVTWRRLRKSSSQQQKERSDRAGAGKAIAQASAELIEQERQLNKSIFDPEEAPPADAEVPGAGRPVIERAGYTFRKDLDEKARHWNSESLRMLKLLQARAPQLAAGPEVQFPLASLLRRNGAVQRAEDAYRRFVPAELDSATGWGQSAATEFWLTRPIAPLAGRYVECLAAPARPVLDGILADECWQQAAELPLTGIEGDDDNGGDRPLALLSYDDEYLYVAIRLPRIAGVRTDKGGPSPRRHDEDLTDFDRVTVHLDTDRDRVTCFSFTIDQRGRTTESCWDDRSWNPHWLVVVDADDSHWRVEAAIPFEELAPQSPTAGRAWGLGVVRTVPAVGRQSWTRPAGEDPRPETFGLMKFE